MIRWLGLLLTMCLPLAACQSDESLEVARDIARLQQAADVTRHPAFSELLRNRRHRSDFSVPTDLAELIEAHEIEGIALRQGFRQRADKTPELTWELSELVVAQTPDEWRRDLQAYFEVRGYAVRLNGRRLRAIRQLGDVRVVARFRDLTPEHDSQSPSTTASATWSVRGASPVAGVTLSVLRHALPMLSDDRIEPTLWNALGSYLVTDASFGGAWLRTYGLSVKFSPDVTDDLSRQALYVRLTNALEDRRFVLDNADDDYATYRQKDGVAVAQLLRPRQREFVGLHLQADF